MFKIQEFSKVMFKATKMFSVISLVLMFSLSVVNAQESNTTSDTTSNSDVPVTTSSNKKSNTDDKYEDFSSKSKAKASNSKGLYVLGQIGYNGVSIVSSASSLAGFTINGLVGYQYFSFLTAEASLGFKYASRTESGFDYKMSLNHYAFDIKAYPLVFRYEFDLGQFSIIPRAGLGLGVAFGSLGYSASVGGLGAYNDDDSIFTTGLTAVFPIGVTFGLGKLLVGLTVEPAFGIIINDGAESLSETRVTVDVGYKF